MRLLAIDPGKLTGAVAIEWDGRTPSPGPESLLVHWEVPWTVVPWWLQAEVPKADLLIIERFFITKRTVENSRQPEVLHVIGGAIVLARLYDVPYRQQAKSAAHDAYPNAALRGWSVHGAGHAKDALRHALLATHKRTE